MRSISFLSAIILLVALATLRAAEPGSGVLPYDSGVISRLSLDGKPRSLSVRQGVETWLGYDLERATVFKAWQARPGKPGLVRKQFVTTSSGQMWFEDESQGQWELRRGEKTVPLAVRYLGCSQRADHFELRWELRHDAGVLELCERVPFSVTPAADRAVRELQVRTLADGEALLPPAAARAAWKMAGSTAAAAPVLTGTGWHRLALP